MSNYIKQNFENDQVLKAEQLNYIEKGIERAAKGTSSLSPSLTLEDSLVSCSPLENSLLGVSSYIEAVQEGSGDPSPENVRPISGWNGARLTRCGKNLLNVAIASGEKNGLKWTVAEDKTIVLSGTPSEVVYLAKIGTVHLKKGETYYLTGCPQNGDMNKRYGLYGVIEGHYWVDAGNGAVYTAEMDMDLNLNMVVRAGINADGLEFKPQVEKREIATPFEPYQGETYTTQFGETIYGGVMDWNIGELTITHKHLTISTTGGNYVNNAENMVGATISTPEVKVGTRSKGLCDKLKPVTTPVGQTIPCISFGISSNTLSYIVLPADMVGGTYAGLQNWIAQNPIEIVYPLEESYTIQFTPQQIETLKGTNNLFSTTGKTKVTFQTDLIQTLNNQILDLNDLGARITRLETAVINTL